MKSDYIAEKTEFIDPHTGSQVIQWTNSQYQDQHLYFTTPSVTADNKYLILISDRTGSPNLFFIDRASGKIKQISYANELLRSYVYPQGKVSGFSKVSPVLDADRSMVYWIQDSSVWCYDLSLHQSPTEIATLPDEWWTAYTCLSPDGRYLCVPCTDPRAFSSEDLTQHHQLRNVPNRMINKSLVTRLYVIDIETGDKKILTEIPFWVTHVQYEPSGTGKILFNSEGSVGSGGNRNFPYWGRLWGVDAQGNWQRLFAQKQGERINHENWISDGSGILFHGVEALAKRKIIRNILFRILRKAGLVSINKIQETYSHYIEARTWDSHLLWRHSIDVPVNHAISAEKNSFVYDNRHGHITYCERKTNNQLDTKVLCWHGSTMSHQDSHPHPTPTPSKKSVIFSSDARGSVNVYEVDIEGER